MRAEAGRRRAPVFRLAVLLLGVLALAGCAPAVQRFGEPVAPPVLADDALVVRDGTRLPLRCWLPEDGRPPRVVLAALHGFNDYGRTFAMPGPYWAARGIATCAIDQRGFGEASEPGIWGGSAAMASDADDLVAALHERHPQAPVYLLGVSMGGAVALSALAGASPPAVAGVVLVAPAVWGDETMPAAYRWGLWLAAHAMPWNRATGSALRVTPSDNVEMLRALGRDPLVIKYTRLDAVYGLTRLMDEAQRAAPAVHVPVLLLYGEHDEIVPRRSVLALSRRLPGPVRVAVYPDGFHMLLRDLGARAVWDDVVAWTTDREAPLPSAADARASRLQGE